MSQDQDQAIVSVPFRYFLARHRVERRDQVAVVDGLSGQSVTYGELHDRVARVAGWLTRHGVGHGDRVACLALNGLAYTELFLALAWIGAVAVPMNMRLNPKELKFIVEDSGAKAIFASGVLAEGAEAALSGVAGVGVRILEGGARDGWTGWDEVVRESEAPVAMDERVTGQTLFMLLYTSGTTGKPKGCMIPQRSWTGYAVNMAACFRMGPEDVYLAFLPYFHVAGFGTAFSQLVLGGTVVTAPLPKPALFYGLIQKHRVTFMFLVPGISAAFLQDEARKGADTSSLRTFIAAAGLEKPEVVDAVEKGLGARYFGIYGQTEAGNKITWASSSEVRADPSTYGHVMPFFDYRLLDENDREVAPGQVGEMCIRGSSVMLGYWNRPEATAETLKNGWHHTGDLFVQLPGGQVKMVDRKKYLVKTGGENVYPQEVEQVLARHPAVADSAVIGIPDERWGEAVKAFVVLKDGATPSRAELASWVGDSIAAYKKPRFVSFVASIPRNVSGKILKNELASLETTPDQRV
jgi:acyl-CoA synthetase (AMP-forming)/AMP-acid ligase II